MFFLDQFTTASRATMYGVLVVESTGSTIHNNTISNSARYGIYLYTATRGNQVYSNTITSNGYSSIMDNGTGNLIS
jgi:parallel beta-helix repeat protein